MYGHSVLCSFANGCVSKGSSTINLDRFAELRAFSATTPFTKKIQRRVERNACAKVKSFRACIDDGILYPSWVLTKYLSLLLAGNRLLLYMLPYNKRIARDTKRLSKRSSGFLRWDSSNEVCYARVVSSSYCFCNECYQFSVNPVTNVLQSQSFMHS